MEVKEISQAVIGRLPRYFRYLGELKDEGVERISSQELSGLMKVTASQIRQDFNNFGGFGQQGYGYNVESLYREIGKILGLDKQHNFVIIGAGNLGRALGNYMNFERRGFIFKGMFDANPELVGKDVRGVKVMPMDQLESFIRENDIDIAVLTIPKTSAVEVADKLVANGIRAIWNFAHVDLNVPEGIQVENVHLSDRQERYATIAKATDAIAVIGSPAEVKTALTTEQGQAYHFVNAAGKSAKAYQVNDPDVYEDIFAVASYQFTDESAENVKVGRLVVTDGKGMYVAQADGTQVSTLTSTNGFIGRIHSVSAGTYYTMIRIQVLQNKDVA